MGGVWMPRCRRWQARHALAGSGQAGRGHLAIPCPCSSPLLEPTSDNESYVSTQHIDSIDLWLAHASQLQHHALLSLHLRLSWHPEQHADVDLVGISIEPAGEPSAKLLGL